MNGISSICTLIRISHHLSPTLNISETRRVSIRENCDAWKGASGSNLLSDAVNSGRTSAYPLKADARIEDVSIHECCVEINDNCSGENDCGKSGETIEGFVNGGDILSWCVSKES